MTLIFADTLYWAAITFPDDQWHNPARAARKRRMEANLVTTEEILTEFLAALSSAGAYYRKRAAETVRDILASEDVTVLPQSHKTFLAALDLYERRADKRYSLTDCVSMNAMREMGITEILTNDQHFAQEGFTVLIRR